MKNAIIVIGLILSVVTARLAVADEFNHGPTEQGDSLYRIALEYRQPGLTMSQLMMSIYRNNPDAFHQQNINRLKVGVTLRIPAAEVIAAMPPRQAYQQASQQIGIYEQQVYQRRVEQGEVEPLSDEPRDPDMVTGIEISPALPELSEPDSAELAEIKQALATEEQQLAPGQLPEPKPAKRKKRQKQSKPLFRYSYDISVIDDDNVRLAQDDFDIRGDLIVSPSLKAKGGVPLDSFTIWNYGASVTYNAFDTFDELNSLDFEINTRYRFALNSGFTAPIYSLGAKIGGMEFDSEMRDSTVISLTAELNKWLTNTINMTAGVGFKKRESVSEAYDTSESRIFANLDTEFSKVDLVYTTLTYIVGDTVSSATPTLDIINVAEVIEPDDAFGGRATNQFAYRVEAETIVLTLGYNRILTRDLSVDISARFVDTQASEDDNVGYDRTIIRASLLGRF